MVAAPLWTLRQGSILRRPSAALAWISHTREVRRIHFAIASGCPNKDEFELAYFYLQRAFSSA
jgi:hypothetical protein